MTSPTSDAEPERARLFVALALPDPARQALAGWAGDVLDEDDSLRLVPADALHVTLAFLGWRDVTEIERIAEATGRATDGRSAPSLEPQPRVLALDLLDRGDRLGGLQSSVERALVESGLHEREERRFRPHLTVARVRRGGRPPVGRFPDPPGTPIRAGEVVVYRSDLRPTGALYAALARLPLAKDS